MKMKCYCGKSSHIEVADDGDDYCECTFYFINGIADLQHITKEEYDELMALKCGNKDMSCLEPGCDREFGKAIFI